MLLKEIIVENFRGYKGRHRVSVGKLAAFIGKNDIGKSTLFEALAIFFDSPSIKIDDSDVCVHAEGQQFNVRIGCVFSEYPTEIIIDSNAKEVILDSSAKTSLEQEYLLNIEGDLEIHKIYTCSDGKLGKCKTVAVANHPTGDKVGDLLSKKNDELKEIAESCGAKVEDLRSNVALRKAIWQTCGELQFEPTEIQLDKEGAKKIWGELSKYLPEYALFQADRPSKDDDGEVQDPLKIAIKLALQDVQDELDNIKQKVHDKVTDVAKRVLEKLGEFNSNLASELKPLFKAEPKWDSLFKLTFNSNDGININKRGSGVRRLILFSFFRAEAERLCNEKSRNSIIYAIEEPETSQHPHHQRLFIEALQNMAEIDGCQVMLTTHAPNLAGLLPIDFIRYIQPDSEKGRKVCTVTGDEDDSLLKTITDDLGVLPSIDKTVSVLVYVEGKHDISFLRHMNQLFLSNGEISHDILGGSKVAFILTGGSSLKDWVDQHYLKHLGLKEVHIYDRDELKQDGSYTYQNAVDKVNNRNDGSVAFLTKKREMENYLHPSAIDSVFSSLESAPSCPVLFTPPVPFTLDDECNVEKMIVQALGDRNRIDRRTVKDFLNNEVAKEMTIYLLQQRDAYNEIKGWFTEIQNRME